MQYNPFLRGGVLFATKNLIQKLNTRVVYKQSKDCPIKKYTTWTPALVIEFLTKDELLNSQWHHDEFDIITEFVPCHSWTTDLIIVLFSLRSVEVLI